MGKIVIELVFTEEGVDELRFMREAISMSKHKFVEIVQTTLISSHLLADA